MLLPTILRLLAGFVNGRLVVGDRNGIHAGDRSAVCYYRPAGGVDGTGASLREQGAVNTLFSAALIVVAVPAMGATFIAGLEGMAGDHSLVAFAVAWKSWWIKDSAGLLLLAPLWTLHSREAIIENPVGSSATANFVDTGTAESVLNLAHAISAFETSAPKVVSQIRETPVHRTG